MLGAQIHFSDDVPSLHRVNTHTRRYDIGEVTFNKPHFGVWTSTFTPPPAEYLSAWDEFCQTQYQQNYQWITIIKPDYDANIYHIDNHKDMMALYNICPGWYMNRYRVIDWRMAWAKFDAVHITENAARTLHFNMRGMGEEWFFFDLNAWDVESTVWFTPKFDAMSYMIGRDYIWQLED